MSSASWRRVNVSMGGIVAGGGRAFARRWRPLNITTASDRSGDLDLLVRQELSPAMRIGFIVAQKELNSELRVLRHAMVRHPSAFLQHADALFLSLGHRGSYARRVNQVLQQRMETAMKALAEHLPEFECTRAQGGTSLWVKTPDWMDGAELSLRACDHGVLIEPGDVFFAQPPRPCPYFRLRLSSIDVGQIEAGIRALREAVRGMGRG